MVPALRRGSPAPPMTHPPRLATQNWRCCGAIGRQWGHGWSGSARRRRAGSPGTPGAPCRTRHTQSAKKLFRVHVSRAQSADGSFRGCLMAVSCPCFVPSRPDGPSFVPTPRWRCEEGVWCPALVWLGVSSGEACPAMRHVRTRQARLVVCTLVARGLVWANCALVMYNSGEWTNRTGVEP